jgi:hypothetical protein
MQGYLEGRLTQRAACDLDARTTGHFEAPPAIVAMSSHGLTVNIECVRTWKASTEPASPVLVN